MAQPRRAAATEAETGPPAMNLGVVDAPRRRQVSGPGMRAFLNIADRWQLSESERLRVFGLPGRSTYHGWAAKARAGEEFALPFDTLLRISAVLGIYKALQIVFTREADGLEWLRSPNHGLVFGGQSPLELVTSGTQDGIMAVRRYLDAWRGGVFAAPVGRLDEEASPISDDEIVFL